MNRRTRILAVLAVLALVLAACGGNGGSGDDDTTTETTAAASEDGPTTTAGSEEPGATTTVASEEGGETTTLTVWSWRPEDEDAYNRIFDVFEEQNPGITVEFIPYVNTEYNNILATGLTGEGGPDVVQLRAYGGVQPLIEAGQLMALDDVSTLENFEEETLVGATGREDGSVYGVPFGIQAVGAFYNMGIFEELGLSEPETWDEFIEVNETLAANDYIPIAMTGADNWMLPILHDAIGATRYGGPAFEEAVLSGETDFNDPDYVASLELINEIQQYLPEDVIGVGYEDSKALFAAGQAGMYVGGSFEVLFWADNAPDVEVGMFRIPAAPDAVADGPLTVGWMDGSFGVNALSDSPEEAKQLVEWMGTTEFGQLWTDEIRQLSANPDVTPTDPLLSEFTELYNEAPTPYLHLVNFRYGDPTGTDLLGVGIQEMLLGDSTAADVAADLQTGVAQWFEPGG